jgi:ATP-dependent DNA helicase RecQ
LSEGDRLLFNELREWRRAKAQSEGVSPYILFTNRQLFEVVAQKPESANSLLQLKGVGPGKVSKYAVEVLAIIGGHPEIAAPTGTSVAQDDAQPSEDDPAEACHE